MRRALAAAAAAAVLLAGCGETEDTATPGQEPTSASQRPTASASPGESEPSAAPSEDESDEAEAIEIRIEGDRIEPNGLRVKVSTGEEVTLDVESDRAAELHVHSSPEQVLEVEPGRSTLTLVVDRPGLVDVEEHESGMVLVQLEVR